LTKGAFERPAAKKDVLADVHVPAKREILVDHLDADVAALVWALEAHRLPGNQDFTGIALIRTGEYLHQRRFAGRVIADQTKNLAGIKSEIDLAKRLYGSEGFFDAPHLHDRLG